MCQLQLRNCNITSKGFRLSAKPADTDNVTNVSSIRKKSKTLSDRTELMDVRTRFSEQGPQTLRAPHVCAKKFMRSRLPISKNKENISEQTGRKCALL